MDLSSNKSVRRYALLMAAFAGLAMGNSGYASDVKLYPGSYCKTTYAGGLVNASNGDPTTLQNTSMTNSLFMTCPIIRDNTTADAGLSNVQVRFFNNNDAKIVSCNVDIRHRDGTYVDRASARSNYGARSGLLTLQVGEEAGVNRSYVLTCWLPPSASATTFPRIETYRVVEFD